MVKAPFTLELVLIARHNRMKRHSYMQPRIMRLRNAAGYTLGEIIFPKAHSHPHRPRFEAYIPLLKKKALVPA